MSVFSVGGNAGAALSPLLVGLAVTWLALPGTLVVGVWVLIAVPLLWALLHLVDRGDRGTTAGRVPTGERPPAPQAAIRGNVAALAVVVIFAGARSWFQVSLLTYLPLLIEERGGGSTLGGSILFVLLARVSAGSLIGGTLSDRVGTWPVLIAAVMLLLPLHYLFLSIGRFSGSPGEFAVAAAMGCCIGATFPVAIVAAQHAWPSNTALAAGIVMGIGYLPGGVGAGVTGLVADTAGLAAALGTLYLPVLIAGAVVLVYLVGRRAVATR
jgi:FSR family fosmidomycin resistance protein-like MFS transporter